jgi:hypothetical protein
MNNKGLSNLMLVIISFAIISVVYFFTAIFVYESGGEYFISPMSEIGKTIIADETVSSVNASVSATINEVENGYLNFVFPFDLFFLAMWIITFSSTVVLAFKTNKEGLFSFFGYLFIGSLMLLLITTYVNDFLAWFMTEIFAGMFGDSLINMPIFLFYIANLGLINFIWWIILVLINIIDRTIISKTGEVEE